MASGDRINLADKSTLDSVNTKVGATSDAASTTPTTLFAGIKSLIANITTILTRTSTIATDVTTIKANTLSSSAVNRVLSGTATAPSGAVDVSVSHASVNVNKSIVIIQGRGAGGALVSRTSTSFVANTGSLQGIIYWQLIEFN